MNKLPMLPDLTAQKVSVPAALFLALAPGMLITTDGTSFPKLNTNLMNLGNKNTNLQVVMFHALVFFIVYSLVARMMGLVLTRNDLIVSTVLFVILNPGMLLTLPRGSKGTLMSMESSRPSILFHAMVFALVFATLRKQFPQFY
jgi:hypothetical protein